ncbi:MAG: SpoIIE family protein phosphatase [Clostridiales Family XIII bacterium]|jgi:sigma-B regulation protein RsbU (phosphoserine phosphatase)|nr:SpoIIE family protein phosphatase [Clostridiales Family XIII bacterium]
MQQRRSIRKKFLSATVALLLILIAVSASASELAMLNIRQVTIKSNEEIGRLAAENSGESLTGYAIHDAEVVASSTSRILEERFARLEGEIAWLRDRAQDRYARSANYIAIPFPNFTEAPDGRQSLSWVLAPGLSSGTGTTEGDLAEAGVLEETYRFGNFASVADSVMLSEPGVSTIYIVTESGVGIAYDSDAALKKEALGGVTVVEQRDRAWYRTPKASGNLYISAPYEDSFGRGLCISLVMPFYGEDAGGGATADVARPDAESGTFKGVIGMDVFVADMQAMVQEAGAGAADDAFTMLIRGETVISAPDYENYTGEGKEALAAYLGKGRYDVLGAMEKEDSGMIRIDLDGAAGDGTHSYVVWSPVEPASWHVVYVLPEASITATAEQTEQDILRVTEQTSAHSAQQILIATIVLSAALAAALLLCVFFANRFSRRITDPVVHLAEAVSRVGGDNLSYTSDIHTDDEIEGLSHSFETMTQELGAYIENLAAVTAEKERIGAELDVASQIQTSMLPCIFPPYPERAEFDLYATMNPAREVGGDFYDFFFVDDDRLCVVIADVSGKGVPAALFMVVAKTLLKSTAQNGAAPAGTLMAVSDMLTENNETNMFVTAFIGTLSLSTGRFEYANAGHNAPYIKSGGAYRPLPVDPGFVLGVVEGIEITAQSVTLAPGDALFLYTDGVTEAMAPDGGLFGDERLLAALNADTDDRPITRVAGIERAVRAFAGGSEQSDDITMLALLYSGMDAQTTGADARMEVGADTANLDGVLDFIRAQAAAGGIGGTALQHLAVSCEEVFVNIAKYAYAPGTGSVEVCCVASGGEIAVRFRDSGTPYNPLDRPDPDITGNLEDRPVGGLGIYLVKEFMDDVSYRFEDGFNILTLRKRQEPSGRGSADREDL